MIRTISLAAVGLYLLGALSAAAQTVGTSSESASSSGTPDTSVYVAGDWTYPSPQVVLRLTDDGYIHGRVAIDCLIGSDGRLTKCDLLDAAPRGVEPARSVVNTFLRYAHVDPASVPGGLRPGARKKFIYSW